MFGAEETEMGQKMKHQMQTGCYRDMYGHICLKTTQCKLDFIGICEVMLHAILGG